MAYEFKNKTLESLYDSCMEIQRHIQDILYTLEDKPVEVERPYTHFDWVIPNIDEDIEPNVDEDIYPEWNDTTKMIFGSKDEMIEVIDNHRKSQNIDTANYR